MSRRIVTLTVLIAPPEAAGVPSHIVSFAQEHVYEQLKSQGLQVVRASELSAAGKTTLSSTY